MPVDQRTLGEYSTHPFDVGILCVERAGEGEEGGDDDKGPVHGTVSFCFGR